MSHPPQSHGALPIGDAHVEVRGDEQRPTGLHTTVVPVCICVCTCMHVCVSVCACECEQPDSQQFAPGAHKGSRPTIMGSSKQTYTCTLLNSTLYLNSSLAAMHCIVTDGIFQSV
eukprot:scaffold182579_cov20-Tisochrysis_lutea.AAC.2